MDWRRLIPSREALLTNRWLRWLAPWLGHPKLWHWSCRVAAWRWAWPWVFFSAC